MRIQHNIMAMNAYRNYTNNTSALAKNLEKLSSGYRINRAGDDAAGLAISEKMRAQITALGTAQKNVKDGISLVKTAEGATQEIHDMLNRMVDLATQSANGTYQNEVDREAIQDEFNALKTEIDRIADSSNFNGIKLLDGSLGLNGDAFKIEAGNTYAEATDDTTTSLVASDPHGGKGQNAAAVSFKINLKDLKATGGAGAAADKANFSINIGTAATITANLTTVSSADASDIGAAFAGKYTGVATSSSIKIGDGFFKATNNSGVLEFTLVGYDKGDGALTAAAATAAVEGLSALASGAAKVDNINDILSKADVKVTATASGAVKWEKDINIDHGVELTAGLAKKDGGLIGGKFDIAGLLADGAKLTVEDATFTVKLSAGATSAGASEIAIDTDVYDTKEKQMAQLKALLSQSSSTNFNINTGSGTKISIDQKVANTPASIASIKDLKVELTTPGQPKQIASTKLTIDESKLVKGNVITVGDKSFVYKGDGSNGFTSAADLASKLSAADVGYKTTVTDGTGDDAGKKVLNIEGKTTNVDGKTIDDAKVTAPSVVGKGLTLQIGEDSEDYNQLSVAIADMHCKALGLTDNVTLANQEGAQAAVDVIKNAINSVSSTRGKLGATQNRLEHTANNLSTMKENIQDAEATIRDTDIAEEMMAYTKNNILVQSAQAMLAQANQIPQGVLQLLG